MQKLWIVEVSFLAVGEPPNAEAVVRALHDSLPGLILECEDVQVKAARVVAAPASTADTAVPPAPRKVQFTRGRTVKPGPKADLTHTREGTIPYRIIRALKGGVVKRAGVLAIELSAKPQSVYAACSRMMKAGLLQSELTGGDLVYRLTQKAEVV